MTNVDRRIVESQRRRYEYGYAAVKAAIKGDLGLMRFWGEKAEVEEESLELLYRFRELLEANRPLPGFLPEQN